MLLGHKIGLASCYYRPTEQKMLDEFQKAIDNLTINEENRLKIKVESLERDKTNYETLDAKIEALESQLMKSLDLKVERDKERYKKLENEARRTAEKKLIEG
jgi:hypothetical protein